MQAIILYLDGATIKALKIGEVVDTITLNLVTYHRDHTYFGDWIPLRNSTKQIVGFKIVPFAKDEYLEKRILPAKFIRLATNASVEKAGNDTRLSVVLADGQAIEEENAQFIEAAIFHNQQDDFVVRLDGFQEKDWGRLGFAFTEAPTVKQ